MRSDVPPFLVNIETGCWEWQRYRNEHGYGVTSYRGQTMLAHRAAWLRNGLDLPPGKILLHACDNPPCVNPWHLSIGTPLDNARDREAKGRGANNSRFLHMPESRRRSADAAKARRRLTLDQVSTIRAEYAVGARQVDLASDYGVSQSSISDLVRGASWYASKEDR